MPRLEWRRGCARMALCGPDRQPSWRVSRWLFVGPSLLMTGLLLGVPVLGALVLSLTDADLRGSPVHFVALANYAILLDDPRARAAIATTTLFALTGAALQVGLGLALALALSAFKKGAQAILALSMLPNIIT